MPRSTFQTISHRDLAKGIDTRSSVDNIKAGYAEDIYNMDTNPSGFVSKRKGYEGYNGHVPLRVTGLNRNTAGDIEIFIDASSNLIVAPETPIVLYGSFVNKGTDNDDRTDTLTVTVDEIVATGTGTFFTNVDYGLKVGSVITTTEGQTRTVTAINDDDGVGAITVNKAWDATEGAGKFTHITPREYYWTAYENESKIIISAEESADTHEFIHDYGSTSLMVGVVTIDDTESLDNESVFPDEIIMELNDATVIFDTSGADEDQNSYIFTSGLEITGRILYTHTSTDTPTTVNTVENSVEINIPASTHGLTNLSIVPEFYYQNSDDSNKLYKLLPDSFEIENATGDITVKFLGGLYDDKLVGTDFESTIVLYEMPDMYSQEQSVGVGEGQTVVFNLANSGAAIDTAFNFYSLYSDDGTTKTMVIPNEVIYSESGKSLTFSVDTYAGANLYLVFMPGLLNTNKLIVDGSASGYRNLVGDDDSSDTSPQGCIYGIRQTDITYNSSNINGGEVTSLSEYSSQGINYLIASLGGVLYKETTTTADPLTLASQYVRIRRRCSASKYIGPFFRAAAGDNTRGIWSTSILNNSVSISAITNNGDETAIIALNLPDDATDLVIVDGLNTYTGLENLITVGAGETENDSGNDTITLSNMPDAEYEGTFNITAVNNTTKTITISIPDLPTYVDSHSSDVGGNAIITSDYIELYTTDDNGVTAALPFEVDDIINNGTFGDDLPTVTGVETGTAGTLRLFLDEVVSEVHVVTGAQITAIRTGATLPLVNVDYYVNGDTVNIYGYTRKFQIQSVDVTNDTITIDESIQFLDSGSLPSRVAVDGRWLAVESPDSPKHNARTARYFDENTQALQDRINSASINDSIYFTNYVDEVMKFDGASITRAGLPDWNPHCNSWINIADGGIDVHEYYYSGATLDTDTILQFVDADQLPPQVVAGSQIYLKGNEGAGDSFTAGFAAVNSIDRIGLTITLTGNEFDGAGTGPVEGGYITVKEEAAYYFKIQIYDRNNNIIASATTDWKESIVEMPQSGIINHKLIGMPKFDVYDYDRVDMMVYRSETAATATPPFYEVRRYPIDYETALAKDYIIITDTITNDALSTTLNDISSNALKGSGFPISSQQPPRCKYINSIANRLVASNIKGYNELTVDLVSKNTSSASSTADIIIGDGTTSYNFVPGPAQNASGSYSNNGLEVDSLTYTDATKVVVTFEAGGLAALNKPLEVGDWVQVSSFIGNTASGAGNVKVQTAYTTPTSDNGKLIGWWKITAITSTLDEAIADANSLKSSINEHIADYGAGAEEHIDYDSGNLITAADATDFATLVVLCTEIETNRIAHHADALLGAAWVYHVGTDAGGAMTAIGNITTASDMYTVVEKMVTEWNSHTFNATSHRTGNVTTDATDTTSAYTLTVDLEYRHGLDNTSNWTFIAATHPPLYFFVPNAAGEIPIITHTHLSTPIAGEFSTTELTYQKTKNKLAGTNPISRYLRDLRTAFNQIVSVTGDLAVVAKSGETEGPNRIIFEAQKSDVTVESTISFNSAYIEVFVNGRTIEDDDESVGITKVFPSRMVVSTENYPEMFDNPYADSLYNSDSIIDINKNDAQEITGQSQFLAVSSSTDSQLESTTIVLKDKSVYAVNIATREQKQIESMGQGCTIPGSIAATKEGVMFANQSGVYVVTRDLSVRYVGKWLEGYWRDTVNKTYVGERATAYTDSFNRQYKLSLPVDSDYDNSEVAVYDYVTNEEGAADSGSWVKYNNIPAAVWKETNENGFFGSYDGRIYTMRRSGNVTDYRDDASGIASVFLYSPTSFNDSGIRQIVNRIITHLKGDNDLTDCSIDTYVDMSETSSGTQDLDIDISADPRKVYSKAASLEDRQCLWVQVKYSHSTIDENFTITGIDYRVSALDEAGIQQLD